MHPRALACEGRKLLSYDHSLLGEQIRIDDCLIERMDRGRTKAKDHDETEHTADQHLFV